MAAKGNRPPAPPKKKRLHTIGVRVDDDLLEKLREMADAELRPISTQLVVLALEGIAAREKKAAG
jgi:hypothetical protein